MAEERLQKLLARTGLGSRRRIEDLIRDGEVTVNGRVATLGDRADLKKDAIKVGGKRVQNEPMEALYLLLHKPAAVMTTTADPENRPTVMDLIPRTLHRGLVPVGRLDFMTTGLLLLTTDGDFAHRIAHPRFGCTKTYEVKVDGFPQVEAINKLRRGITIDGKRTGACVLERRYLPKGIGSTDNSWWTVILTQGRTRQIREMFLRIGHPVQKLRRVAIGALRDSHLPMGGFRELHPSEIAILLDPPKPKPSSPPRGPRKKPAKGRGRFRESAADKAPRGKARASSDGRDAAARPAASSSFDKPWASSGRSTARPSGGSSSDKMSRGPARTSGGRSSSPKPSGGQGGAGKAPSRRPASSPLGRSSDRGGSRGTTSKKGRGPSGKGRPSPSGGSSRPRGGRRPKS